MARRKNPMTLARAIAFVIAPAGVILCAWTIAEILRGGPDRTSWVAIFFGTGISLSMIIVGVRYLLKQPGAE